MNIGIQDLKTNIVKKFPEISLIEFPPSKVIFEESVKLSCFYCGRYGNNWKCPPNLPMHIKYRRIFSECQNGMFVALELPFDQSNYSEVRSESTLRLHRAILDLEKMLWDSGVSGVISFIGGSCKLCKNGCGKEKCNNPYEARSPFEAIGVNVVKSAALAGISIVFPPKGTLKRVGFILW